MNLLKGILALSLVWAAAGVMSAPAYGETKDDCKGNGKNKNAACKKAVRSLASLAPSARPIGQGEAMLNSVTSPSPRFLRSQAAGGSSSVKLAGVCTAADGVIYHSGQKGYSDCLDARTNNSGSQSDYFSAQRQAGVGVLVGK